MLNEGYGRTCLPLAGLPGVFPAMAADFQQLKLIPTTDINETDGTYRRVASVDHPFRELVGWAYMANAGRAGLPDRDLASLVEDIANEIDAAKAKATNAPAQANPAAGPPAAAPTTGSAANAGKSKGSGEKQNAGD